MPSARVTSVPPRLKGATDFESYYNNLCALQETVPIQSVKAHLKEGALDINADRIRLPDWGPILNSIRVNKNLSFIGIRSYFQQTKDGDDVLGKQGVRRRPPAVRSKEVVNRLCIALKECLLNNSNLQYLEVQGLPLKERDITNLAKGLSRASALEHLSLEGCRLGNKAITVLCHNIRNCLSLVSLNLTGCGLTSTAAQSIAKVVKHQSTRRHSEAWKESLRYRRPDLDRMAGIRRITLNSNPLLNDEGASALADAIRDDLWLKALDLQHCGLSNTGAQVLLNALHENSTIVVLDVRNNALVDREMVKAVIEQVMINGGGHESEYKWLRSRESTEKTTRRKVKYVSKVVDKKSSKQTTTGRGSRSRMRSKSADGRLAGKNEVPTVRRPGPGFVPWRTAARAVSRGASVEREKNDSSLCTPTKDSPGVHFHMTTTSTPTDTDTTVKDTSSPPPEKHYGSTSKWKEKTREEKRKEEKELRVELEEIRRRHYVESKARSAADAHVVELEVENSRLRHEIQMLQARGASSPFKKQSDQRPDGVGDLDEGVLDSIEESFRKFHAFLDLLRDAGLGQLCTLIGISAGDIKNPSVLSILRDHQPTPVNQTRPAVPYQQEHARPFQNVGFSDLGTKPVDAMPPSQHATTHPMPYGSSIPTQSQPQMATGAQQYAAQPVHPPPGGYAPPPAGWVVPPPVGWAVPPTGWVPQPTGFVPSHSAPNGIHYTQSSSVSYKHQLPPQSQGIMYPPQSQMQYPSTTSHVGHAFDNTPSELLGNVGQVHITGAQTQDVLGHVGIDRSRDSQSPEGQQGSEAQHFQNILESGIATMPKAPSTDGNNLQQKVDAKRSIFKQPETNGILTGPSVDNEVTDKNGKLDEPDSLALQGGEELVIQGGKINRNVIEEDTEDTADVNRSDRISHGPRGDANSPPNDFQLSPSPDRTSPAPSPERTPSPAYSDSWASGSSRHSSKHSRQSASSREQKSDGENVKRVEKSGKKIMDVASDRSSPSDIVEELLDYSSDDEF